MKKGTQTSRFQVLSGRRFGRLVVLEMVARRERGTSRWACACDCGKQSVARGDKLRNGQTRSCGCLGAETRARHIQANALPPGEAAFRSLLTIYRRNARLRRHDFSLTADEFRQLVTSNCHYCGIPPQNDVSAGSSTNGSFRCGGVDRLYNDRGYTLENCRSCCTECNMAKGSMGPERWSCWLTRIAIHRWSKTALRVIETDRDRVA